MAHFTPFTPLYWTPDGSVTADPSKRQLGSAAIGTAVYPRTYLCDGPVKAGDAAYLVGDGVVSATPSEDAPRVYVESTLIYHHDGKTEKKAAVLPLDALDYTRGGNLGTTKTRAVDIHAIACDDAPKEVDPVRWRAVVNTVFADCSESTPTSRMLARRGRFDPVKDIAHDLAQIAPVVAAYAVARFVWGYDVTSATADALARCKREDDPALTRYLIAYERA